MVIGESAAFGGSVVFDVAALLVFDVVALLVFDAPPLLVLDVPALLLLDVPALLGFGRGDGVVLLDTGALVTGPAFAAEKCNKIFAYSMLSRQSSPCIASNRIKHAKYIVNIVILRDFENLIVVYCLIL